MTETRWPCSALSTHSVFLLPSSRLLCTLFFCFPLYFSCCGSSLAFSPPCSLDAQLSFSCGPPGRACRGWGPCAHSYCSLAPPLPSYRGRRECSHAHAPALGISSAGCPALDLDVTEFFLSSRLSLQSGLFRCAVQVPQPSLARYPSSMFAHVSLSQPPCSFVCFIVSNSALLNIAL